MNPYPVNGGTAHSRGAQRTKLNFEINIPVVITLEFNPPEEERPGRFGPQFMYFVNDGLEIGFFDPPLHDAIVATGARAGDTLAIVKRRNGRATRWEVNQVKGGKVIANAPPPEAQLVSAPSRRDPQRAANIQSELLSTNLMTAALRQAIEACEETGFAEKCHPEDVRAIAITIYISLCGGRQK